MELLTGAARERLLCLLSEKAYREGDFTLSSGEKTDYYIDGKQVALSPEGAFLIGEVLYEHTQDLDFNAIGGLAVGAVPMVTSFAISCYLHERKAEGVFVRNEPKSHGTMAKIEGVLPEKARVIIVDDVVTTGSSIFKAIRAVEHAGAEVVLVVAVVDREIGARKLFESEGYKYRPIFTKSDVSAQFHA